MRDKLSRRSFLARTAAATAGVSLINFPHVMDAETRASLKKLRVAQIGCGGRAMSHVEQVIATHKQTLVAMVDPDSKAFHRAADTITSKGGDPGNPKTFSDYRVLFDKMGKELDAVFIATPNHHHHLAAMLAMNHDISVYCEKPVCHDVAEARELRATAASHPKIATQMGNQGHCLEGYRRLCEYIWAGAIGNVTETHSWTNRANGGVGPRPPSKPVPKGLDWDSWIGPSPYRDYHDDLHPHEWHCWYDFGNGGIGNLGCHVLDGLFWSLKIEHPTSFEEEYVRGGTDERLPLGSRVRWDVPARGAMPAMKAYWYEGLNPTTEEKSGHNDAVSGDARNLPPLLIELKKKYPDEADVLDNGDSGTLYVGDKGIIATQTYGKYMHIVPQAKMDAYPEPPATLPRTKDIFTDFINACLEGSNKTGASFDYGTRLTEFAILGNLAQKAGLNKKVEWDGPNMRVTNIAELNDWVKRPKRKGWQV